TNSARLSARKRRLRPAGPSTPPRSPAPLSVGPSTPPDARVSLRAGAPRSPIGLEDLDQFAKGGQLLLRGVDDRALLLQRRPRPLLVLEPHPAVGLDVD